MSYAGHGWSNPSCKSRVSSYWLRIARTTRRILKEMEIDAEDAAEARKFAAQCSSMAAYARQGRI